MLKIMHRLMNNTGKYKGRIRASYITAFLKGLMLKAAALRHLEIIRMPKVKVP